MAVPVSLRTTLQQGYRPDDRLLANVKYARACDMAAATEFGLVPIRNVVQPITNAALSSASIVKSHPWPALHRGKKQTWLCEEDGLFNVTENPSGNWTIAAASVYDWRSYNWDTNSGATATIVGNQEWQFADLFDTQWLFNGTETLMKLGISSKVFHQSAVTIRAGATYQDSRLFLGGFDTNLYALAPWNTYLQQNRGELVPDDITKLVNAGNLGTFVWWSSMAAVDALRFFSLPFMIYGTLSANPDTGWNEERPWWRSVDARGQVGLMAMPGTGQIVKLAQVGKAMLVVMTDGVHALVPNYTNDTKGFGYEEVAEYPPRLGVKQGTNTRAAAGGDEKVQAIIAENSDLYVLMPDGNGIKAEKLGYRHLFSEGDDWQVSYDGTEQEFHFSAADRCYRLSKTRGFVRAPQIPTTVHFGRSNGTSAPIGIFEDDANAGTVTYTSDYFSDMTGIAVPQCIRIWLDGDGRDVSDWTVAVYCRRYVGDELHASEENLTPTARGACDAKLSGSGGFYVTATHPTPSAAYLKDIIVEFDDGQRRSLASWNESS